MIQHNPKHGHRKGEAHLYLNGKNVGTVKITGGKANWTLGHFTPNDVFSEFAPVFGRWSLLIHDDEEESLSVAASEELRETEYAIDKIEAKLFFAADEVWVEISEVNIDGKLIEWKGY